MNIQATHKRDREEFELPVKKILIFKDEGTTLSSVEAITSQLAKTLETPFTTKCVNSHYLKTKNWEAKTFALIMGGGHCSYWENGLGTLGMLKIHHFVARGGRYLGICAGAYFAAATSTFQLGGQNQITKTRPLAFYQGCATGPLFTTENHLSPESALAAKIDLFSKKGRCYYQGGCAFDIVEDSQTTRILARYRAPYQGSAIISCSVGAGMAVLSGLHPEYSWQDTVTTCQTNPAFSKLVKKLIPNESFRQDIWKAMLHELFKNKT